MVTSNLLQGETVRLTALRQEDLPTLVRWYQDAGFLRLFDSRPAYPRSEAQLAEWLDELRKADNIFAFGIRRLDSDDLIGYLELDGIQWPHRVCGMGMGIGDRAEWGKGYGHEAARLALAFAFRELNLRRVEATVFSYNERSIALLEKLGFEREGVYRERLERDGTYHDMYLYGLLRREWEATN